jgi:hypothetical protein
MQKDLEDGLSFEQLQIAAHRGIVFTPLVARALSWTFEENGWAFGYCGTVDNNALFRACSPAAVSLLKWAAPAGAHDSTEDRVAVTGMNSA